MQEQQGQPGAARQPAKDEAESIRTGKSPKQIKRFKQAKTTQQAKLLTILVQFNEKANDDFQRLHGSRRLRRRELRGGQRVERPDPQPDPEPGHEQARRQQLDVGQAVIPVRALQQE